MCKIKSDSVFRCYQDLNNGIDIFSQYDITHYLTSVMNLNKPNEKFRAEIWDQNNLLKIQRKNNLVSSQLSKLSFDPFKLFNINPFD